MDILELVFALVAGFFWLFGSSIFRNRENDEPSQPTVSRRNKKRDRDSSHSDDEARQQEIRESILRKIAERRQQGDARPVVVPQPEPYYQEPYEAFSGPQEEASETLVYTEPVEEQTETSFSWNAESNPYEKEMQARLQEIEATKRKAEALRKKLEQATSDADNANTDRYSGAGYTLSLGSVRSALKNPQNARVAFVYGEVLGKPVSLRSSSGNGLGV